MEGKELAQFAAALAEDKKAQNIIILDLHGISLVTDYFLIASGNSMTQVKAVAEEIEVKLEEKGIKPINQRKVKESGWILLDYGDVVVHIMRKEERDFYQLEKLWGDGDIIFQSNLSVDI